MLFLANVSLLLVNIICESDLHNEYALVTSLDGDCIEEFLPFNEKAELQLSSCAKTFSPDQEIF